MLAARAWRLGGAAESKLGLKTGERGRAREVDAWLFSAFEDAAIGTALVDLDPAAGGRVVHVNPALCELAGRTRDSLVGTEAEAIVHPGDQSEVRAGMTQLATGELSRFRCEGRLTRPGVEPVWVILNLSVGRDGHGRPTYAIWQLLDIEEPQAIRGRAGVSRRS